jgi:uncharacterized protein (UPF0303 family)
VKNIDFYSSVNLLAEERALEFLELRIEDFLGIGEIAKSIAESRNLPIAVGVKKIDWFIFLVSLPGSTPENHSWLERKARVVNLNHHSTLYERVNADERGVDWFKDNNCSELTHAIHGGGLPLITKNKGFVGSLLLSGLPHLEDHLLGVEVLTEFLARKRSLH